MECAELAGISINFAQAKRTSRSSQKPAPLIGRVTHGFARLALAALFAVIPPAIAADLNLAEQQQLQQIVDGQIAAHRIPGAVILIGDATHVFYRQAFGQRAIVPAPEPMTLDTAFDLASLTKVIATTTAVMQLVEAGRIHLDAPVAYYWPAFAANGKHAVTVRQLLAHTSGLRPDLRSLPHQRGQQGVLRAIAAEPLLSAPGEKVIYSDLNFIALGEVVQRVTHQSLDAYCRAHIFKPLNMQDTTFLPSARLARLSAPTTADPTGMRRGRVQDPTANWMGGVSGNAGLFSTGADLARFAQMVLNNGRLGRTRILQPASITALASVASPLSETSWRGIGWELAAPFVTNQNRVPPIGAIGHAGFTGTGSWIDLATRQFVIILTNRVHPHGNGDARPLRAQVLALLASRTAPMTTADMSRLLPWTLPALREASRLPVSKGPVQTGIDVLEAQTFAPLAGMRIGLITNRSGFDAQGKRTVDVLAHARGVTLAALFSPEHGLNTDVDAPVGEARDAATGLIVHSLYGTNQRFPADSLAGLDALVFDIQDAGVRFFTYETTLGYALEAAAEHRIPLFVLDRPNPLGADRVGGPVLDSGHESFTGYFPLPLQSGMTVGELADLFNQEKDIDADLRVIPMNGYRRSMRLADTGLGWVPPSPNLRTPTQLDLYPDVAMLEGANISVGRGTPHPFEWIGAPWIDGEKLARWLNALDTGARFEAIDFVPTESTWHGQLCHGVSIKADASRPVARVGLALLSTLHALYPSTFDLAGTHGSVGSSAVLQAIGDGAPLDRLEAIEAEQNEDFATLRKEHLRY